MRKKVNISGIFSKVFLYTMLILLLIIGSMFLFFSNQIRSTVTVTQQRQAMEVFLPLFEQLRGKTNEEIISFAEDFHIKNASFSFCFIKEGGEVLFQTENFTMPDNSNSLSNRAVRFSENTLSSGNYLISLGSSGENRAVFLSKIDNGLRLYVASTFSGPSVYAEILERASWVFGLVFLVSLFAAFLFARRIAEPIKKVSGDTHAMSLLLFVEPPKERRDEIGRLSKDVYAMYSRLKSTIDQLENEVERVKRMEENQRYFFSAASHELKTPIAAVGAIFEGMLNDVISPEECPAYLREGLKLVREQNKLVSEILELVKLSGEMPAGNKAAIPLRQCVQKALDTLSPLIELKEQVLTVDIDDDLICELNNELFSKALSNVLLNASQNSPSGSAIRVAAHEEKGYVSISVWNGEAEIPPGILPRLFEPFFRTDEARTPFDRRSGLGLTIVKKALDLMEISFRVINIDGGVLFQMDIPQRCEAM